MFASFLVLGREREWKVGELWITEIVISFAKTCWKRKGHKAGARLIWGLSSGWNAKYKPTFVPLDRIQFNIIHWEPLRQSSPFCLQYYSFGQSHLATIYRWIFHIPHKRNYIKNKGTLNTAKFRSSYKCSIGCTTMKWSSIQATVSNSTQIKACKVLLCQNKNTGSWQKGKERNQ